MARNSFHGGRETSKVVEWGGCERGVGVPLLNVFPHENADFSAFARFKSTTGVLFAGVNFDAA